MSLHLQNWLHDQGVNADAIAKSESRQLMKKWLAASFGALHSRTRKWKLGDFYWSAYLAGYVPRLAGVNATEKYQSIAIAPYYVLDEDDDTFYDCSSPSWPDLWLAPHNDLYLFPKTLAWTYAMAHDKHNQFFAFSDP
jgi:hypothetical protein